MQIITIPEIGDIQLIKHARAKSMRISLGSDGMIKITIPKWAPYSAGIAFAQSKKDWILEHLQPVESLKDGVAIGKFHHLYFKSSHTNTNISTRQKGSELWVTFPDIYNYNEIEVQKAAKKIAMRALRNQAENLLPKRLADLALKHSFEFKSVTVRQLKARWGSCNNQKEITLNLFLMQLPWELIDYVLVHELTHTKAMHHGPDFWDIFESAMPGAKNKRKQLKNFRPDFS